MIIEVCVDSVRSAVNAVNGGATRLELCGNLGLGGGITPSLGLLKAVQRAIAGKASIMVMIRPRTGDFLYSDEEIDVMLDDIEVFKGHGVQGVVIGALTPDGKVDASVLKRQAMPVCFHRAFDMTANAEEAFQTISEIGGTSRILTSGHAKTALDGIPVLRSLFLATKQSGTPSLLPGSGINENTIQPLMDNLLSLGMAEVHLSGGSWQDGGMLFRRGGMGMGIGGGGEWGVWVTNETKVRKMREVIDARCKSTNC